MKIAFVGAGWVAGRHLGQLTTQSDLEIVGHVSPVAAEREAATRRWGGRAYTTVADLLSHEKVEAAWITVPPGDHGAIEDAFLERSIPLFIEKPLSADRATGVKIGEKIQKKGLIAAVGYHWRAMDTLIEVKKRLAKNPPRMVLAAWHDSTPPPVWWRHQKTSGGQMVEQVTHLFDLARYLVGEGQVLDSSATAHPHPIYADADVANVSAALLNFPKGVPGVFSATCLLGGPAEIYLKLVCEGLLVSITQTDVTYETAKEKQIVRLGNDPFLTEDRAFITAIKKNDPGLIYSSYTDALLTHALCHDVLEKSQRAP